MPEVDVERVAAAVGEEVGRVFGQYPSQPLQLHAHAVVGGAVGRAVQAEADDEDPLVDAELDAVAAAAVAPLVAAVGGGLEPMAHLSGGEGMARISFGKARRTRRSVTNL